MPEVVVFPSPKQAVIAFLAEVLGVWVSSEIPSPRPAEFVRVLLSGGAGEVNPAYDDVMITVEAWADDEARAEKLAQLARAHMREATRMGDAWVTGYRSLGPPVDLPDESRMPRYVFSAALRFRGRAI